MANETPTYQERRLPHKPDPVRTHYEGCWQEPGHHNCAVVEVRALRARIEELEGTLEDVTDLIEDARTRAFEPGNGGTPDLEWVREPLNEAKRRARRALESDHGEQSE